MITLQDIIRTLNQIEVKGKDNMDRLLGAIIALEQLLAAVENTTKPQENTIEDKGE